MFSYVGTWSALNGFIDNIQWVYLYPTCYKTSCTYQIEAEYDGLR
jgi:hypothetical protein